MSKRQGALPEEWALLDAALGLTSDLLPVVSNFSAKISSQSKIVALGKTPSIYNKNRHVAGVKSWTSHQATSSEILTWSKEPDYGICIQTRDVRALDIDVTDSDEAAKIADFIHAHLQSTKLPLRLRANSSKCLFAFRLAGSFPKRVLKCASGMVEFLANGQQFIACGTHTSGVRYEWDWHGNDDFPALTLEQFETLWAALVNEFATEAPSEGSIRKIGEHLNIHDATLEKLHVLSWGKDGRAYITCPFKSEHTSNSGETETAYFPAGSNGYEQGHFVCLHAHCAKRSDNDFLDALCLGIANDFDVIEDMLEERSPARFPVIDADVFANGADPEWIVEDVLPEGEMAMIYGESTAGKSFFIFDMVAAVALGIPWRGKEVKQGRVVYIAAEGAQGFRKRLRAYMQQNTVSFEKNLAIIDTPPNFMKSDSTELAKNIIDAGKTSVIVIDTLAQTTPGADENSSDMNKALAKCKALHKSTGALVILIHHAGKDAAKGARGWSGIKAAMDAEIEITRKNEDRFARVTKLKDGEDGALFPFKLLPVVVGETKKGKEITSCVVQHTDAALFDGIGPVGKWQKAVYQVILDLSFDSDPIAVRHIIEESIKCDPFDPGPDLLKPKRDRRPETAKRALYELKEVGLIVLENNRVLLSQNEA